MERPGEPIILAGARGRRYALGKKSDQHSEVSVVDRGRAPLSMPDSKPAATQPAGTQPAGTLPPRVDQTTDLLLGSGRAGVVFKSEDDQGRITARKVFDSDALTRAVQYLFLGSPNPYAWCVHAVQAAMLRRRILLL